MADRNKHVAISGNAWICSRVALGELARVSRSPLDWCLGPTSWQVRLACIMVLAWMLSWRFTHTHTQQDSTRFYENYCNSTMCSFYMFLFPTAVTVGFYPLGLGVLCRLLLSPKTGTEPQRWKPGTLEPVVSVVGLQSWISLGFH